MENGIPISERTLGELLPDTLTDSLCIDIEKDKNVWELCGMLPQYLETVTDSVLVWGTDGKPIGVIGGREIMENILKNQTYSTLFDARVEEIMEPDPVLVTKETKYKDLMNNWKNRGRAYAIILNETNYYSAISAKKILEIGMRCNTQLSIEDLPKKQSVTFNKDATLGAVINSMCENKTRKILLENSNQYLNDRKIIETMIEKFTHAMTTEDFLNESVNIVELEKAKVISDNLRINEVSEMMHDMFHPYVIYKDWIVTPWDICEILLSEEITEYAEN